MQRCRPPLKAKVDGLQGLHCQPGTARSREGALAGRTDTDQPPTARSQPQPVVRAHPVTGRPALYLCEWGQMDWVDGPFVGLEPGPHGAGAALLDELMAHYTRPEFVYVHEWTVGDLVVWDNRCLVHAATWYDGDTEQRMMWRTTVRGNPGAIYEGEKRSWLRGGEAASPADSASIVLQLALRAGEDLHLRPEIVGRRDLVQRRYLGQQCPVERPLVARAEGRVLGRPLRRAIGDLGDHDVEVGLLAADQGLQFGGVARKLGIELLDERCVLVVEVASCRRVPCTAARRRRAAAGPCARARR